MIRYNDTAAAAIDDQRIFTVILGLTKVYVGKTGDVYKRQVKI